ncbi:hypothetical protein U2P60_19780 [Brucella sp. H1_1004]|uniref:hypothetical protein n=1 Tax=Brucella sp. H1_1004 TaxID=3110109 RepID=UPI0039B5DFD1
MIDEGVKLLELHKERKEFLCKIFKYDSINLERRRLIRNVVEKTENLLLGKVEGQMCLRVSVQKRKTQGTVLINQDDGEIRRLTFGLALI